MRPRNEVAGVCCIISQSNNIVYFTLQIVRQRVRFKQFGSGPYFFRTVLAMYSNQLQVCCYSLQRQRIVY